MLIVRGDAQTLPSELNKAATGEVWFDPILPKTDGVDVGMPVVGAGGLLGQVIQSFHHSAVVQLVTDGHAPSEYRADTVRNLDSWYEAFAVQPGQKLYLAPAERVPVW